MAPNEIPNAPCGNLTGDSFDRARSGHPFQVFNKRHGREDCKSRSSATRKYWCLLQPRGARGDVHISCGICRYRIAGRIKSGQHLFCGGVSSSGCLLYPCSSGRKIFRNAVTVVIHHAEVPLRNGDTCLSRSSKPRRCFREIACHSSTLKIKSTDHLFCRR
jgi:hypothetical protein